MQATTSLRGIRGGVTRALVLAAIGTLGLSIGRWVVPAMGSAPATVYQAVGTATSPRASGSIMERKLDQMDREDTGFSPAVAPVVASSGGSARTMERQLEQMDREDTGFSPAVAPVVVSSGASAGIMERKLDQMDREDAGFSPAVAASITSLGASTRFMERQFEQMDREDAR